MSELLNSYKISLESTKVQLTNIEVSQTNGGINVTYSTIPSLGSDANLSQDYAINKIELYGSDDPDFEISENTLLQAYDNTEFNLDVGFTYAYDMQAGTYQYIKIIPYDSVGAGYVYSDSVIITRDNQLNVFNLDEAFDKAQNWFSGQFAYEHTDPPYVSYSLHYYGDPESRGEMSVQVSGHASQQGVVFYLNDIPPAYGYKLHVLSESNIPTYAPQYSRIELTSLDSLFISSQEGTYASEGQLTLEDQKDDINIDQLSIINTEGDYASDTDISADQEGDISDFSDVDASSEEGDYGSNTEIGLNEGGNISDISDLSSSDNSGFYGSDTEIG
jgi:hypothetical protein